MRCLVTGASGAVGPVLVGRLVEGGHDVSVFSRSPHRVKWPAGVVAHAGDLLDGHALQSAMKGCEVVFHLAALLHVANPAPSLSPEYQRVNVDGTRALVEAAQRAGVGRIVLFSTIAVYGPTGGRVVDESATPAPDTMYAETKLAAEAIVLGARNQDGQPLGTVLRSAAVYGGRVKGNYFRLVGAIARGRFVNIGKGGNRRTLVFEDDLADAAIAAASAPAAGRVFNVSDGGFHPLHEIVDAIAAALGRRPPRVDVPASAVRVIASLADAAGRPIGARTNLRAAIDTYLADVAVDGSLIQNALGWRPRVDLRTGWARAVSDMRREGVL